MRRDRQSLLEDIRSAGNAILRYTRGKSVDDYIADDFLRSAVERQFEIVGEAMTQLDRSYPALARRVSARRMIIGFRNVLAHGYFGVSHERVWEIATDDLPGLLREVRALIKETK
jgi:uncharacterized protein with HEPN domain